jgi:dTDP-4-dehydrorhamnose reductase
VKPLQIWGGLECTLNRVGDRYINQCEKNGHIERLSDLKLFHDLGIQNLRYPCLWELVAPKDLDHCNWDFLDERLGELRKLGQNFIAGFLHHGSGPYYTSLIDPDFPEKFATYARHFINRYPWVNDFTPINEINTTARFSTLYGHWYPHLKSECMYLQALILQCKGSILAMREIKRVNPKARFIQTDDLGKCQSTDDLREQRNFENERRWLAWDLLCGKVTKYHPLYQRFIQNGISPNDLDWFQDNACPPDIIGVNHYLLSNRYLDHRLELFPEWSHGGNGIQSYADVGAVDTGFVEPIKLGTLLLEAWERYQIPMAITECHVNGRRESQMRWLKHVWNTCQNLRLEGVTIEAVTAWSLLGTYDWNSLCTTCNYQYEPGVFDLRNPERIPKETAMSKMVRSLALTGNFESPLLDSPGTWETNKRIVFNVQPGQHTEFTHDKDIKPILITGARGTLGQAFAKVCEMRNIKYVLVSRQKMDISDERSVRIIIDELKPWAVINAAGYVRVDEAEDEKEQCFRDNVLGAVNLAKICREKGIGLVNFSSDLVFDGNTISPYTETNTPQPLNTYGRSKADCEKEVLEIYPDSMIVRTSAFFGPWDEHNFVTKTLRALISKNEVHAPSDMYISPTYIPDLANETLDLLIDGEKGIVHITNVGEVSWEEFALKAALALESSVDPSLIKGIKAEDSFMKARRPKRSVLVSEKHSRLPTLDNALKRYFSELQVPLKIQQESRL